MERVERRVEEIGLRDPLFQVVEDQDPGRPAEAVKGLLVELAPDLGARTEGQEPYRLAAPSPASVRSLSTKRRTLA